MKIYKGFCASPGLVLGQVSRLEHHVETTTVGPFKPSRELQLLTDAIRTAQDELESMADRAAPSPEASLETLLVLDAITGQNAISQAKEFCKAADATGIILTKLDGTAKGGCVVAVKQRLGLPVRFIGVGEGIDDLLPFTPEGFVEELLPRQWKH